MKAVCVHRFGGIEALRFEDVPRPLPGTEQVLVRVKAAGVGPWDALIREGQSTLGQTLPLVLGAEFSGVVEAIGSNVTAWSVGDAVFGCTNDQFTGAYAEYAVADADKIAEKPAGMGDVEAASVPVVAVTAYQMVFGYGGVTPGQRVLIQGAAGNVGAYAVQFAKRAGAVVFAVVTSTQDTDYVRGLGADVVISAPETRFENAAQNMDIVLDTVGSEVLHHSFAVLKPGGVLVSVVAPPDPVEASRRGVRGVFFIVDVDSPNLRQIAELLHAGNLETHIGEVLPLSNARVAHEMLAGAPHKPGKIILTPDSSAAA